MYARCIILWLGERFELSSSYDHMRNKYILIKTGKGIRLVSDSCGDPESFVRGGQMFLFCFFKLIRGERMIQILTKTGYRRPASETPYINGVSLVGQ